MHATHDNVAEENIASGNTNGIVIGTVTQGNVVRRNLVVGNPPVQISVQSPSADGVDIKNLSDAGAVTFDDNRCLTYTGPGPAPCPNVGKPPNEEAKENEDAAAPGRNRLAAAHALPSAAVSLLAAICALWTWTGRKRTK